MECFEFKPYEKGALKGYAIMILTIAIENRPVKFVQKGYKLWMKDGKRWVTLPQDKIEKNGEVDYVANSWLLDKDIRDTFSRECVAAIDKWCAENNQQEKSAKQEVFPPIQKVEVEGDFPF